MSPKIPSETPKFKPQPKEQMASEEPKIDVTGKALEDHMREAETEAKALAESLIKQSPELEKKHEAMARESRAKNREKYLVWAKGLTAIPHKTMVKTNVKNIPHLEMMFGVEVPVVWINETVYAIRDKEDGKFYIAGTKDAPVLKPGDKIDLPYSKGSYSELMASARGAETNMNELMAKRASAKATKELLAKKTSGLTIEDIDKMTPEQRRGKFLKSDGTVDFKGNKLAENEIGLINLFGPETEYLLVYDHKTDKSMYAKRENDGSYTYMFGRKGKVKISTGDMVMTQTQKEVDKYKLALARDAQEKERNQSVKREVAARKVKEGKERIKSLDNFLAKTDLSEKDRTMLTELLLEKYPRFDIRKKANETFISRFLKDYEKRSVREFNLPGRKVMLASFEHALKPAAKPTAPESKPEPTAIASRPKPTE